MKRARVVRIARFSAIRPRGSFRGSYMGEFRGSWCDTGVTMYGHWCHHVSDTGVTMYGHWCHHKKTTGYSHCLKTPTQVNASGGDFRQHKKTNSFKKTNVSKKTKTPALDSSWRPTAEQWSKLKEKHEGKDIEVELEKFRDWHIEKKSQYKDWNRAFDNWLKRARPSRQQLPEVDYVAAYGLENAPF